MYFNSRALGLRISVLVMLVFWSMNYPLMYLHGGLQNVTTFIFVVT